ncbi:peptidase C26 family protein [Mycobacteroides abscessus 21]|uniref:Glutamine amidotransferase n=1 Tax=Mycobacteroides abscessus 21 TaxID=1299324 RepID=A0A829Q1X6_9MYCO|nr:peptidase C26 family protein [Mycobacteroides abscessus 21]
MIPHSASVEEIKGRNPRAIVLSGGPSSVYEEGAPQLDPGVFDLDVPVFGICYGFQAMAQVLGGTVAHTGTSEYGRTELTVAGGDLHEGLPDVQPVWMSHGDAVTEAPQGFTVVASSEGARWRRSRIGNDGWPGCSTTPRCCTRRMDSRC